MNNRNQAVATRTVSTPVNYAQSPQVAEWQVLKEQAQMMIKTGFLPKNMGQPEQVVFLIMAGRELGMGAMWSAQNLQIVDGKVSAKAEAMLALVFKNCPGATVDFVKNDAAECRIEASRPGKKSFSFGFTLDDATKAGLTHKDNWKKYTRAMLRSRAVAEMCRSMFPDAIAGICSYTPEEIYDMREDNFEEATPIKQIAPSKEEKPLSLRQLLAAKGVTEKNMEEFIGKPCTAFLPEDHKTLRAAYQELEQGKTWGDLMEFSPMTAQEDKDDVE